MLGHPRGGASRGPGGAELGAGLHEDRSARPGDDAGARAGLRVSPQRALGLAGSGPVARPRERLPGGPGRAPAEADGSSSVSLDRKSVV